MTRWSLPYFPPERHECHEETLAARMRCRCPSPWIAPYRPLRRLNPTVTQDACWRFRFRGLPPQGTAIPVTKHPVMNAPNDHQRGASRARMVRRRQAPRPRRHRSPQPEARFVTLCDWRRIRTCPATRWAGSRAITLPRSGRDRSNCDAWRINWNAPLLTAPACDLAPAQY